MKKLINDTGAVVPEALAGLAMLHPGIVLLPGHTIALRADAQALRARGEVALISGGGAGHCGRRLFERRAGRVSL